jgi:hypothetical protein
MAAKRANVKQTTIITSPQVHLPMKKSGTAAKRRNVGVVMKPFLVTKMLPLLLIFVELGGFEDIEVPL